MLTNYFTLRQLVREWKPQIAGLRIEEAYSQEPGEVTIAFEDAFDDDFGGASAGPKARVPGQHLALKISVQAPLRYIYLNPDATRARKNVSEQFPTAGGDEVVDLTIAANDRLIDMHLASGMYFRIELFGPRANVYLLDENRCVVDRFRQRGLAIAQCIAESARPVLPDTAEAFALCIRELEGSIEKRLRRVLPIFDAAMLGVAISETGIDTASDVIPDDEELISLFRATEGIARALDTPHPRIYWKGDRAEHFALNPVTAYADLREQIFDRVDEVVRLFVRRKLAQIAYDEKRAPLERILKTRLEKAVRSRDKMTGELKHESRADRYEHFGHILMALQSHVPAGARETTLEDVISGEGEITIPLRTELTPVQNAEKYYNRARDTRKARVHTERRLKEMQTVIGHLEELLGELHATRFAADVVKFKKRNQTFLSSLSAQGAGLKTEVPFRRYVLENGYEVWVGRNAEQNDRLTTKEARKYDLWMHARGVAGSHTVLRVPRRDEKPPKKVVQKAASIAAYHSKARTSELAPVIVAERRYVRKPRKSPLGTVVVERETVLLVPPELPES